MLCTLMRFTAPYRNNSRAGARAESSSLVPFLAKLVNIFYVVYNWVDNSGPTMLLKLASIVDVFIGKLYYYYFLCSWSERNAFNFFSCSHSDFSFGRLSSVAFINHDIQVFIFLFLSLFHFTRRQCSCASVWMELALSAANVSTTTRRSTYYVVVVNGECANGAKCLMAIACLYHINKAVI